MLVKKGENPNWTSAGELNEEGIVEYQNLTPATEYTVYTRVKGTANALAGEAVTTDFVTSLNGTEINGDSGFVGATITVVPDPEDAAGLAYQWFNVNYNGDNYTDGDAIAGATSSTFTSTVADLDKYFKVIITKGGEEIGSSLIGPIEYGTVEFDPCGGSAPDVITGTAYGDKVNRPADPTRSGYRFIDWYKDEEYQNKWDFENDTLENGYVVLYAKWTAVSVPAYVYDDDDDDDTPPVTSVTIPVSGDDEKVNVTVRVSGDTATVTGANVDKVLEAEKVGTVTIDVSSLKQNVTEVSIPGTMVKKIADAVADESNNADGLEIKLPTGTVTFDGSAVAAISEQANGKDLRLNLEDIGENKLNTAQKDTVRDMDVQEVLDAYMTSNGQRIRDFRGGRATVTVPYELKAEQRAAGVTVWYVADNGDKTEMPSTYDGKDVKFTVEHFSNYVIAYDAERAAACPRDETCPVSAFTDTDPGAWYHDGVHYALEKGLMNGVGDNRFDPNGTAGRGMIVTILYRMENEPEVAAENPFGDVVDGQWYTNAVIWAAENKIVDGYGGGKFGPNDHITREQLVTILYRYAKWKGVDVSVGEDTNILSYDDAFDVSEWAIPAMQWAVGSGAVGGRTNTTLNPKDTATRAEAATIIMRYCTEIAK